MTIPTILSAALWILARDAPAVDLDAVTLGGTFEYPTRVTTGRAKERIVSTIAGDLMRVDMGDRCSVVGRPGRWLFLDHRRKIGLELKESGSDRFWGWQGANEICQLWPAAYGWADSRGVYEGMMQGYKDLGEVHHYKADVVGEGDSRMDVITVWGYVNWGGLTGTTTFGVLRSDAPPHTRLWRFQADISPSLRWTMEYEGSPKKEAVMSSLFAAPAGYAVASYGTAEFVRNAAKAPFSGSLKPRDWLRSLYAVNQRS